MSKRVCKIIVTAYQKEGKSISEGENPEVFEFCCWHSLSEWMKGFSLHKCEKCKNE